MPVCRNLICRRSSLRHLPRRNAYWNLASFPFPFPLRRSWRSLFRWCRCQHRVFCLRCWCWGHCSYRWWSLYHGSLGKLKLLLPQLFHQCLLSFAFTTSHQMNHARSRGVQFGVDHSPKATLRPLRMEVVGLEKEVATKIISVPRFANIDGRSRSHVVIVVGIGNHNPVPHLGKTGSGHELQVRRRCVLPARTKNELVH